LADEIVASNNLFRDVDSAASIMPDCRSLAPTITYPHVQSIEQIPLSLRGSTAKIHDGDTSESVIRNEKRHDDVTTIASGAIAIVVTIFMAT